MTDNRVLVLFVPQATTHSFAGYLIARWFVSDLRRPWNELTSQQGMVASVGNSMVGGVIADIYEADDRGSGMNMFSLFNFMGQVCRRGYVGWSQVLTARD